ncbi:hypothetical protein J437_LFUL006836 [Ladona fulva]|uniref:Uncharacterized protein n=1 Tax=Ladona fulva TaxID=123851 RepID=A0A8K0KAL6_LADFU|nr:hypothetical protein J437_LFUL006836 [Ladona fulva]
MSNVTSGPYLYMVLKDGLEKRQQQKRSRHLKCLICEGKIEGKKKGRRRTPWMDNIKQWVGLPTAE